MPPLTVTRMPTQSVRMERGEHVDLARNQHLPFRQLGELGTGGSAVVYEVEEELTGKTFAHKALTRPRGQQARERYLQAFKNEVKILKRLGSHPHIVEIYWTYTHCGGAAMLLSPVASDGDLQVYLKTIKESGESLTSEQCSTLGRSFGCLASGLAFIHKTLVRHKDIKPQNILVHQNQMIYTDFSISHDATEETTTTTTGPATAFTERYSSPEVAADDPRNTKSDIFSLGCVFLEIMTVLAPDASTGRSDSDPYREMIDDIQNNLTRLSTSGTALSQLFSVCGNMLEHESTRRSSAEAVVEQILSIHASRSELPYELICTTCKISASGTSENLPGNGVTYFSTFDSRTREATDYVPYAAEIDFVNEEMSTSQELTGFSPYSPRRRSPLSKQDAIRALSLKELSSREKQVGYLYIFYDARDPDFVRIGRVANNVPLRLRLWERHCGRQFSEFRQQTGGERQLIQNVRRVEQLVMAELMDVQYMEKCKGCGHLHFECFRTTPQHAAKVIMKYSGWTAAVPLGREQRLLQVASAMTSGIAAAVILAFHLYALAARSLSKLLKYEWN